MPKTKKKFIDRKNAVTFQLVHRSQRDPLAADETAPQRVLVPVEEVGKNKESKKDRKDLTPEERLKEQHKWGIYYDDDYNYLQHLKESSEITMLVPVPNPNREKDKKTKIPSNSKEAKINLPSSVFASEVEEDVGLLNKAAPQGLRLDLDPDVVAAMDDDFNFDDPENELEDNFMELAMGEGAIEEEYEDLSDEDESGSEMSGGSCEGYASDDQWEGNSSDEDGQKGKRMPIWEKEETKSRFSNYSMSSSVIKRNEGLTMLDNRFEKMFAAYDDTELGALDCEEIEGNLSIDHEMLMRAADEFEHQQKSLKLDKEKEIARLACLQQIDEEEERESEEEMVKLVVDDKKQKWDCESILSTYSNLYNHPKIIEEPKRIHKIKIGKSGIPVDALNSGPKLTMKSLAKLDMENSIAEREDDEGTCAESVMSTLSVLSIRPKDENPDEKKERKRLLREYRKERRLEKKANKEAFKEEKKRQEQNMINNRNNVQGSKIV